MQNLKKYVEGVKAASIFFAKIKVALKVFHIYFFKFVESCIFLIFHSKINLFTKGFAIQLDFKFPDF